MSDERRRPTCSRWVKKARLYSYSSFHIDRPPRTFYSHGAWSTRTPYVYETQQLTSDADA